MNLAPIVLNRNNGLIVEAFYQILEYSNNEIIITDENLNIIFHNSKFDFKNKKFSLSVLAPDFVNKNLNSHFTRFKNSDKNHIFFRLVFNDEENNFTNVPLNVHICKIKNNIGKLIGYSIILQDITQELKNNLQKQTMIDVLMHDLKTPLSANIQAIELLLDEKFGEYDDGVRLVLDELLNSSKFINYMMDNLIIKYKNEFSLKEISKQKYSFVDFVKQRCSNLLTFFDRKNQNIEIIVEDEIPLIYFDVESMEKVVNNLLINASEQSTDNSKIIVYIKRQGDSILVSFINNGSFETGESLNRIFDEYIACTNKFRKIGFGIELYNCKKIIEAHQGTIWAESTQNKGTSINFSLPIYAK